VERGQGHRRKPLARALGGKEAARTHAEQPLHEYVSAPLLHGRRVCRNGQSRWWDPKSTPNSFRVTIATIYVISVAHSLQGIQGDASWRPLGPRTLRRLLGIVPAAFLTAAGADLVQLDPVAARVVDEDLLSFAAPDAPVVDAELV